MKREGGLNLKRYFISLWKQKEKKETRRRKEKEEYSGSKNNINGKENWKTKLKKTDLIW